MMTFFFDNLFIPVDFSINTDIAVAKGLKLCEGSGCQIHLFHVNRMAWAGPLFHHSQTGYFMPGIEPYKGEAQGKLEKLATSIEAERPDIKVITWLSHDLSVQRSIIKKVNLVKPSLIIIGKHSNHRWLTFLNTVVASELVEATGVPVLTVKPGALHNDIKNVVIPVGMNMVDKLEIAEALKRKFRIHVHLVSYLHENNRPIEMLADSIINTISWIKGKLQCPVTYNVLAGNDKGRSLLNYCENINADMVVVDPNFENRVGWLNKRLADVLPVNSKTQIMEVST